MKIDLHAPQLSGNEIKYVKNQIMNQLSYFVSNEKVIKSGFVFNGSLEQSILDTFNWFN